MRNKNLQSFFKSMFLVSVLALPGCISSGAEGTVAPAKPTVTSLPSMEPSITPFQPEPVTPTPGAVDVWISPILPEDLKQSIENLSTIGGRSISLVADRANAQIRVEENPMVTKSNWIFALVAPFSKTLDSISFEELLSIWKGEGEAAPLLFVSPDSLPMLEILLGKSTGSNLTVLEEDRLLEAAWSEDGAYAIIPFEELEPKWKVIEIDGMSPIDKKFITDVYPLGLAFGFSGDGAIFETLANSVDWPVSNRDPQKLTIVVMTGVTALTRATAWTMKIKGIEYPAQKIGHWLREADITHISNEVSFLDTCPPPTPDRVGLKFCSDPEYIRLLEVIGTDVIELTGNHIKDYGDDSLLYSMDLYRDMDWQYFGGGADLIDAMAPALFEHNGNRIAFLGCNSAGPSVVWAQDSTPGALPCEAEGVFDVVNSLREEGILPIFTFQWNEYYQPVPSTKQRQDFRAAMDAGAVIVSGSQAHQPQIYEFYADGLIHYGLGNLFFDQMWSIVTRQEIIDRHVFYGGKHVSTEVLTAILEDFAQPRPMSEEERLVFLRAIFAASDW